MQHGKNSAKRFSAMLDPEFKVDHTIPAAPKSLVPEEQYTAECVCACNANDACVAAAIRETSGIYVCHLSSKVGEIIDTVLDVTSYTRVAPVAAGTCANLQGEYATVADAMSLLVNYKSPVVGVEWGIQASSVIQEMRLPSLTHHERFTAKVNCLHECCKMPLCSAAYIKEGADDATCTILANGGVPLDVEGMRITDQGSSESVFYSLTN
jgi:hypothetical protein